MVNNYNQNIATGHFELAYKLQLDGKIEQAIEAYKLSIKYFPTAKAHTFLGWAYSLQGRFEEAISECLAAIDLDPDYGNPYNDIGSYLISLNKLDEAVEWLEKAIAAPYYEERYYPYYNLGMIQEKKGDWINAIKSFNRALFLNPEFEAAQSAVLRLTTLLN